MATEPEGKRLAQLLRSARAGPRPGAQEKALRAMMQAVAAVRPGGAPWRRRLWLAAALAAVAATGYAAGSVTSPWASVLREPPAAKTTVWDVPIRQAAARAVTYCKEQMELNRRTARESAAQGNRTLSKAEADQAAREHLRKEFEKDRAIAKALEERLSSVMWDMASEAPRDQVVPILRDIEQRLPGTIGARRAAGWLKSINEKMEHPERFTEARRRDQRAAFEAAKLYFDSLREGKIEEASRLVAFENPAAQEQWDRTVHDYADRLKNGGAPWWGEAIDCQLTDDTAAVVEVQWRYRSDKGWMMGPHYSYQVRKVGGQWKVFIDHAAADRGIPTVPRK